MQKLLLGALLLSLALVVPMPAMARVDVSIGISLPPLITFQAPPEVIVMPDTYGVYAVPDIDAELFFWNGWWWRPWEGRWYRSHYYDRGWTYYNYVPRFYYDLDPGWRRYYRDRNWYGHRWEYERIPHQRLQQNWRSWDKNRYWERQKTWGVQNYKPRPQQQRQELRQQRQQQYRQRPEVQQHQQQIREQQKQKGQKQDQQRQQQQGVKQDQQRQQQQSSQPHGQGQQNQGEPQHQQRQGKPDGGGVEERGR